MPHDRKRYFEAILNKELTWSACVSVLGMRQTGKTTVLKKAAGTYFTFDDPDLQGRIEREGQAILDGSARPVAFDEAQKYPPIFDRIKLAVDQQKRPGRFLLSGSVRFTSKKSIRESLTGRGSVLELHPFTLSECHSEPLSSFAAKLIDSSRPHVKASRFKLRDLIHYMKTGGLPGICFNRSAEIRAKQMQQHLDTLLSRDLQFLYSTRMTATKAQSILRDLAKSEGKPFFASPVARTHGMTAPTFNRLLDAMEGLFLIRRYGRILFLEDQGLKHFLNPVSHDELEESDWFGMLCREINTQCSYAKGVRVEIESYTTQGGAHVPWVLKVTGRVVAGITYDHSESPTERSLKSLGSLLKANRDCIGVALHRGNREFGAGRNILCYPAANIF